MKLKDLSAEFPRADIHWRAQTLTKNGDKALALAYLDARDVMGRLDDVCGPENWQDKYTETPRGRMICSIGIRVGDIWVWKSDGAGDTAVEGEKGGISDAFKRAAVKWGIGRYLYDMKAVWARCEVSTFNGKPKWKKWIGSPWDAVGGNQPAPPKEPEQTPAQIRDGMKAYLSNQRTPDELTNAKKDGKFKAAYAGLPEPMQGEIRKHCEDLEKGMTQ